MKKPSILTIVFLVAGITLFGQTANAPGQGGNSMQGSSINYQLLSFTAKKQGNSPSTYAALLNWSAVGETQIIGYDIERTVNQNAQDWTVITTVPGSNNNTLISRNYIDALPVFYTTTFYYRLKIFYTDNTVHYSSIVSVTVGVPLIIKKKMWP